jgi:ATP-dependent Clp protease adapter protein ClpS
MVCAPTGKQKIVANIPTLIPSFVMARLSYRFADVGPCFRRRRSDVSGEAGHLHIILHSDPETPLEFIIELLHSTFNKPIPEALKFTDTVDRYGRAVCGTYPREVADGMLKAARRRIRASGHSLLVTGEPVAEGSCKLCGALAGANAVALKGTVAQICDNCMSEITNNLPKITRNKQFEYACEALAWHFAGIPQDQLVASSRQFPGHMRADVQAAVDRLFSASPIRFFGIDEPHRYETLTIAALTRDDRNAHAIAPAQYHDLDVGESVPAKCLNNGLWLCESDGLRYAVVLSSHREYARSGVLSRGAGQPDLASVLVTKFEKPDSRSSKGGG